jgi:hypothetical protein
MINAAHQIVVDSVKKITFKHYRTGEKITKILSEVPHLNMNPTNHRIVFYNHEEEAYEDISKSSIVSIEDVKE